MMHYGAILIWVDFLVFAPKMEFFASAFNLSFYFNRRNESAQFQTDTNAETMGMEVQKKHSISIGRTYGTRT